ncbi:TPA: hypothetical protein ACH3X1_015313 [Trebouxia sp. C0004]
MREQGYAALNWTVSKAKAASRGTCKKATNLVSPALRTCSPMAQAVWGKSKDLAGVAMGSVALQTATVPTINLLGISAAGPTAGSWAAYAMSLYGGTVPAGGLYATAQAMAMGGTAVGLGTPVAIVSGFYLAFKGTSFCVTKYRSSTKHQAQIQVQFQHPPALKVPQSTRRKTDTQK